MYPMSPGCKLGVPAPNQEAVGQEPPRVAGAGARAAHQRGLPARAEQLRGVGRRLRAHQLPAATQRQVPNYPRLYFLVCHQCPVRLLNRVFA